MLSKRRQAQNDSNYMIPLYEMAGIGKFIQKVVQWLPEAREKGNNINGYWISFGEVMKMF